MKDIKYIKANNVIQAELVYNAIYFTALFCFRKMETINSYKQPRDKPCFYLQIGVIFLSVLLSSVSAEKSYKSSCETIPSEIHITKGKLNA